MHSRSKNITAPAATSCHTVPMYGAFRSASRLFGRDTRMGSPQRLSVPVASLHRVDTVWMTALAAVAQALNEDHLDWMLLGSAATALRGAEIEPGDVDIATNSAVDVTRAATLLPTPDSRDTSDCASDWISTTTEPTLALGDADERWTFGRWIIHGVKVSMPLEN